jgi:hypothetical protein
MLVSVDVADEVAQESWVCHSESQQPRATRGPVIGATRLAFEAARKPDLAPLPSASVPRASSQLSVV